MADTTDTTDNVHWAHLSRQAARAYRIYLGADSTNLGAVCTARDAWQDCIRELASFIRALPRGDR